ncbi:MAG: phosphoglucosamine mutase [Clostridia bacterium]|nr:phosphoglucosamine mutase [Clostridia bacterium]MBR2391070.1 phosphoglucosamine mutase [Clostridia bacterium]
MGLFFGTDGLRGKVNDDLSYDIAYKCGNALGSRYSKILIGRDTRHTGSFITLAFATGAMNAGSDVTDVGVCPTAGISYLTKELGYDFGVVISASHNPAEYNGIKIFDSQGKKLGDKREEELEKSFLRNRMTTYDKVGTYEYEPRKVLKYEEFLANSIGCSLKGKTIVLDCSNGASFKIAPAVFRDNGAKIIATFCKPDGLNINKGCGSLHIERLQKYVLKYKADMGFAFDGDSDRLIAVDENGEVVDGDKIIYMLALEYLEKGKLVPAEVVGTRHTNMGVEKALKEKGISLLRTDIGDKYVAMKLAERGLLIGGEQSGHVFVKDKLTTGDGILNALLVASICVEKNKKLSEFFDFVPYSQCNINILVSNKMNIMNSEKLMIEQDRVTDILENNGRVMIRMSGTEPYIRVMVESQDEETSAKYANELADVIKQLNLEFEQCAE